MYLCTFRDKHSQQRFARLCFLKHVFAKNKASVYFKAPPRVPLPYSCDTAGRVFSNPCRTRTAFRGQTRVPRCNFGDSLVPLYKRIMTSCMDLGRGAVHHPPDRAAGHARHRGELRCRRGHAGCLRRSVRGLHSRDGRARGLPPRERRRVRASVPVIVPATCHFMGELPLRLGCPSFPKKRTAKPGTKTRVCGQVAYET